MRIMATAIIIYLLIKAIMRMNEYDEYILGVTCSSMLIILVAVFN